MKRLLITFGLLIAFFLPSANASIFDDAIGVSPKISSNNYVDCSIGGLVLKFSSGAECASYIEDAYVNGHAANGAATDAICFEKVAQNIFCSHQYQIGQDANFNPIYERSSDVKYAVFYPKSETQTSCPPDEHPLYTFGIDTTGDGEINTCYNPEELDNLSNCLNDLGNMLPVSTNSSQQVCKTNSDTGSSCGYSLSQGGASYHLDLEIACFGDGDEVPEYDNDSTQPYPDDDCNSSDAGLMVCVADPDKECDANGVCTDQCGFVNGGFYCFHECEGDECFETTPPEPTEPEPCEGDDCDETPVPCEGDDCEETPAPCVGDDCEPDTGGGGGGSDIDLSPIVDELKEINKELDFTTVKNPLTLDDLGGFGTIFGDSDIEKVRQDTLDKKDELTDYIDSVKSNFSTLFELKGVNGGAYDTQTLDLTMGTFNIPVWDYIVQNSHIIGSIVMFLAFLIAARVLFS